MKPSEGIAEAISLTLGQYDLQEEDYEYLFNGAVETFVLYINGHKPADTKFNIERCAFTGAGMDGFPEEAQEKLLHDAEAATDTWIEENLP